MFRRTILVLAIAGAVAACGSPDLSATPAETGPEPVLAHHDVTDFPGQVRKGQLAVAGRCIGIARSEGAFLVLLWPPGYDLDRSGRGVRDPAGILAAEFGTLVEVGGAELVAGSALEGALERSGVEETCPGLEYFFVAEVIAGASADPDSD